MSNWSPNQHPRNPDGTFKSSGRGTQRTVRAKQAAQAQREINAYIRDTGDVGNKRDQRREAERWAKLEEQRTRPAPVRKRSALTNLFDAYASYATGRR